MAFFDDNQNYYPISLIVPLTPSQKKEDYEWFKKSGFVPISRSFYRATFHPIDYVNNSFNHIMSLLNERSAQLDDGDYKAVFVWDIGEITTLTSNHTAQCQLLVSKGIFLCFVVGHRIGMRFFIKLIKRVLKKSRNKDSLHLKDFNHIEDVIDDETDADAMNRMTYAYSNLEQFYNEMSNLMREDGPIINYELIERCGMVGQVDELYCVAEEHQRLFQRRWQTARKSLELVNKRSAESHKKYANVALCRGELKFGVTQLLISGASKHIPIENIYSTRKVPKKSVFERIQRRFGEKCVLVYITSRPRNASILETLQIPIWEIKANDSIEHLHNAQRDFLLR